MKIHAIQQPSPFDFMFFCPGCKCGHGINTTPNKDNGRGGKVPVWSFNNDFEKPTIRASCLVSGVRDITDEEHAKLMAGEKIEPKKFICHSFVTDGNIQFLSDSTHELSGKTIPLEDF